MPIAQTHVNVADPIMTSGLLNPHSTDLTHLPPKSRISVEQYHTTAGSTHECNLITHCPPPTSVVILITQTRSIKGYYWNSSRALPNLIKRCWSTQLVATTPVP